MGNTVCAICGGEFDDRIEDCECSGAREDSDWRWLCKEDGLTYLNERKHANGDTKRGEWILMSHVGQEWTSSYFDKEGNLITNKYVRYKRVGNKIEEQEDPHDKIEKVKE